MNTTTAKQTAALRALLATMNPAERTALLDVLSIHIENVETSDECADGETEALKTDGHVFLVTMRDAIVNAHQRCAA